MSTNYKREIATNAARDTEIALFLAHERIYNDEYPGIIFVDEKAHGKSLAAALSRATGKHTPVVTADMAKDERAKLAARMDARDPELPAVVATTVWSTGINIPNLRWVTLAGAKISAPISALQSGGRGLRRPDGKVSCEVINVCDEGRYEQAADRRSEHLAEAGYTVSDEEFVRSIPAAPTAEPQRRELRERASMPGAAGPQDLSFLRVVGVIWSNALQGLVLLGALWFLSSFMQMCK